MENLTTILSNPSSDAEARRNYIIRMEKILFLLFLSIISVLAVPPNLLLLYLSLSRTFKTGGGKRNSLATPSDRGNDLPLLLISQSVSHVLMCITSPLDVMFLLQGETDDVICVAFLSVKSVLMLFSVLLVSLQGVDKVYRVRNLHRPYVKLRTRFKLGAIIGSAAISVVPLALELILTNGDPIKTGCNVRQASVDVTETIFLFGCIVSVASLVLVVVMLRSHGRRVAAADVDDSRRTVTSDGPVTSVSERVDVASQKRTILETGSYVTELITVTPPDESSLNKPQETNCVNEGTSNGNDANMVHTLDLPKSDALNSDDQSKESLTESTSMTIAEDETAFQASCSPTSLDATKRASMYNAENKETSTHDLVGVFSSKNGAQIKDSSGEDVTRTVESADEVTMVQHFANDNTDINSDLHNAESTDSYARNGENTSTHDGENTSTHDGENTSTHDGENISTHDGENTSTHDGENTSTHDGENTSTHDGENTMNGAITSQSLTETVVNVKECTLRAADTNNSVPDTTYAKDCTFEVDNKIDTSADNNITNSSSHVTKITTDISCGLNTTGESPTDAQFTRVTLIGAEPFSSATLNAGTTNSCSTDTRVFTNNATECVQPENKMTSSTDLQARPAKPSTRVLQKVASKPLLVLPTREKGEQKGGGERMNSVRWAHPAHETDGQTESSPGEAGVSIPRNDSSASVGTVTSRRSVSRSSTITLRRLKSATMTAAKRGALMVAIFLICYLPLMVILLILSLDHPVYETALLLEGFTLPISYVHALLSPVILMRAIPELRAQAAGVIRWCCCRKRPERPG